MITDKSEAIKLISKENVDFDDFDKTLLRDKDVALAYMQHHSSNEILNRNFPINIDINGMVDNIDFILDVIKHLDVGYNQGNLVSLLKYSASKIVKNKIDLEMNDTDTLKEYATKILATYNETLKARTQELEKKQTILNELNEYIDQTEWDAFKDKQKSKGGNYKRCDIGFTAMF